MLHIFELQQSLFQGRLLSHRFRNPTLIELCWASSVNSALEASPLCSKVAPADSVEYPLEASPLCSKVALADLRRRSSRSITSLQQGGSGRLSPRGSVFFFKRRNQGGKRTEGHNHSITHTNLRRPLPPNFNIARLGADLDRFSAGDGGATPSRTQC